MTGAGHPPARPARPGRGRAARSARGSASRGESPRAIRALWDLIGLPTLNVEADGASLALAAKVFRTGLLDASGAADIGVPLVPAAGAARRRRAAGAARGGRGRATGRARPRGRASRPAASPASSRTAATVAADAVIVAVPNERVGERAAGRRRARPDGLRPARVVSDRQRPRRVRPAGAAPAVRGGRRLAGAVDVRPHRAVRARARPVRGGVAVGRRRVHRPDRRATCAPSSCRPSRPCSPGPRQATVERFLVTRERQATFRQAPGTLRLRPPATTSIPRLYLAGAWTDTGWPATMEGAVRSGMTAARAALVGARQDRAAAGGGRGVTARPTATLPGALTRSRGLIQVGPAGGRRPPGALAATRRRLPPGVAGPRRQRGGAVRGARRSGPTLTLLAAEAVGAPATAAVPGAVALELVHNFSLIHDDLMDGDRERRHRPTVWALFGAGEAIIAGRRPRRARVRGAAGGRGRAGPARRARADARDARDDPRAVRGPLVRVPAGRDRAGGRRHERAQDRARSSRAPARWAPSWAAGPTPQVDALRAYGRHVGIAFQAVDDVLGIWGEPDVTGKPAAGDLRQHKKTLPVAHALAAPGPGAARAGGAAVRRRAVRRTASTARSRSSTRRRAGRGLPADRRAPPRRSRWPRWTAPGSSPDRPPSSASMALFVVGRDF